MFNLVNSSLYFLQYDCKLIASIRKYDLGLIHPILENDLHLFPMLSEMSDTIMQHKFDFLISNTSIVYTIKLSIRMFDKHISIKMFHLLRCFNNKTG